LGSGSFGDLISAIIWAAEQRADVINMSLSGYVDRNLPGGDNLVGLVQRAVDAATKTGAILVASAGNSNLNLDTDPANFTLVPAQLKNIISVGATAPFNQTNFDDRASYSNYGGRTGVDLMAPGGDFLAGNVLDLDLTVCSQYQLTLPFACGPFSYVFASGTSESAPHVAAAAAVVESIRPGSTPARITSCLLKGSDIIGPKTIYGAGRLNVAKAAVICP
jgi:serine protease